MIWTIIIIVILFILIKFLIALSRQSTDIKAQGGMRTKYSDIIQYFKIGNVKVLKETNTYILLEITEDYHKVTLEIYHTFSIVTIKYIQNHTLYGHINSRKWEFPSHKSHYEMLAVINRDLNS